MIGSLFGRLSKDALAPARRRAGPVTGVALSLALALGATGLFVAMGGVAKAAPVGASHTSPTNTNGAPTTQAPAIGATTSQTPTTQAPASGATTSQTPTTQAPAIGATTSQTPTTQAPASQAPAADTLVFVVAEEGNEARYRVREQLARLDFPNDAVGRTSGVQGRIMVTGEGEVIAAASRFVIDLASLESDSDRRDNFLRRNTLGTADYPEAIFVPREVRGLSFPLTPGEEAEFVLVGDLTVRAVTRPVEWRVEAEILEGGMLGRAETRFTFGDFELTIPSVGSVLSIRDEIRLEFDFRLVSGG